MQDDLDVLTLGETMVLFHPPSTTPLQHATVFEKTFAGAETNVAVGLSRLGHRVGWISRLGDDAFGRYIYNAIRGEGIDTTHVTFDSQHSTGVFFKEHRPQQESRIFYYRNHSAASRMSPSDLDESWFRGVRYFHLTGITPALSETCRETVFEAIAMARRQGAVVVFDPNIRFKLWPDLNTARDVLMQMAQQSDIILPGVQEGTFLVGHREPKDIADAFLKLGAESVVVKLGQEGAYYATPSETGRVPAVPVAHIVDSVGAGDAFASGLLSGLLQEWTLARSVELGAQLASYILQVPGDIEGFPYAREIDPNASAQVDR